MFILFSLASLILVGSGIAITVLIQAVTDHQKAEDDQARKSSLKKIIISSLVLAVIVGTITALIISFNMAINNM